MKYTSQQIAEAKESLHKFIKEGDTVYTILENVSRSGMQRTIRVVVPYLRKDTSRTVIDFWHPNYSVAVVLGRSTAKKGDGIICNGCGMDMGFELAHNLGCALFGDGYKINHRWM